MSKSLKICILDYGSGNVGSVFNIVSQLQTQVVVSNNQQDIVDATHLILPGVGAFGASMAKVRKTIPLDVLTEQVFGQKKPFLGICVGLQLLATEGEEFGLHQGLNWIPGRVTKIDALKAPLPHIGWNDIQIVQKSPIVDQFIEPPDFYFVHSYGFHPVAREHMVATTTYGQTFTSIAQRENIYGVQFHPEKSQKAGKILLENFFSI